MTMNTYTFNNSSGSYTNIMKKTGGFRSGELVILAARPGCGKTTLALNMAVLSQNCGDVLFESIEMTKPELVERVSRFSNDDLCDMVIYDRPELSIDTLESDIIKHKPTFVFVDYLQLLSDNVKKSTKRLKAIAKKYGIVLVILAQLNRKAADHAPTLAMLKDSGNIEQDADQVWFITEDTLIIAKNRKGDTGSIAILFHKQMSFIFEDKQAIDHNAKLMAMVNEMESNTGLFHFLRWSRKIKQFDYGFWYNYIKCSKPIPHELLQYAYIATR